MRYFVRGAAIAIAATCLAAAPAAALSRPQTVTPDGTAVAFSTTAALVAADGDTTRDVYVWRDGGGLELAGGGSPKFISDDGKVVYFESTESLVPQDDDTNLDLYQYSNGTTRLVSGAAPGMPSFQTFWAPYFDAASSDGRRVFFDTVLPLLPEDTDQQNDVYKWERGTTTLVSRSGPNASSEVWHTFAGSSSDGKRVFENTNEALVVEDTGDGSDVYERHGGSTTLVSKGTLVDPRAGTESIGREVSDDGKVVTFTSTKRLEPNDLDVAQSDLYQRADGQTRLLSANADRVGPPCTVQSDPYTPPCSQRVEAQTPDGSHTVFATDEPLVSGDESWVYDFYDATTSSIEWLTGPPAEGTWTDAGTEAAVSADGSRRVFETSGQLSAQDTDGRQDIYVRAGGATTLLSDGEIGQARLWATSRDGTRVFFHATASFVDHVYDLYEGSADGIELLSTGPADSNGANDVFGTGISEDGTRVFFVTDLSFVADDQDYPAEDLYMRSGGVTTKLTP